MKIERDEDTFSELKLMGEDIHLISRNYNDEIIGIDYYSNLSVLSHTELEELQALWLRKSETCYKEKLASQWMVVQIILLIIGTTYIAAFTGGKLPGIIAGVIGLLAMIAMVEDERVSIAKRNCVDAKKVYERLKAVSVKD